MEYTKMLDELGVNYLTGEADRTGSNRILFDIPAEFTDELREYLGGLTLSLPEGWNDSNKIAVMMEPVVMRQFVIWLARRRDWYVVHQPTEPKGGEVLHFCRADVADDWRAHFPDIWIQPPFEGPTRNRHQMSGRAV